MKHVLKHVFDIAETLLTDKEDLVQKGYGWMLKAASVHNQKQVFEFLMKHKTIMPRIALRYALEKMPANLKKRGDEIKKSETKKGGHSRAFFKFSYQVF